MAEAEGGAGPALFPFLTDGTTRRLGRHFANCVKLGEWELVSGSEISVERSGVVIDSVRFPLSVALLLDQSSDGWCSPQWRWPWNTVYRISDV